MLIFQALQMLTSASVASMTVSVIWPRVQIRLDLTSVNVTMAYRGTERQVAFSRPKVGIFKFKFKHVSKKHKRLGNNSF